MKRRSLTRAAKARAPTRLRRRRPAEGQALSAPTAANTSRRRLPGSRSRDVRRRQRVRSTAPAAHATFKTVRRLVVDIDGWMQDHKHFVALRTDDRRRDRCRALQGRRRAGRRRRKTSARTRKPQSPAPPAAPSAERRGGAQKSNAARVAGWDYEIPGYKYESIFKPLDELDSASTEPRVGRQLPDRRCIAGSTTRVASLSGSCAGSAAIFYDRIQITARRCSSPAATLPLTGGRAIAAEPPARWMLAYRGLLIAVLCAVLRRFAGRAGAQTRGMLALAHPRRTREGATAALARRRAATRGRTRCRGCAAGS